MEPVRRNVAQLTCHANSVQTACAGVHSTDVRFARPTPLLRTQAGKALPGGVRGRKGLPDCILSQFWQHVGYRLDRLTAVWNFHGYLRHWRPIDHVKHRQCHGRVILLKGGARYSVKEDGRLRIRV